jgi:RND family efflux transporter MFP subunit
MLEPQQHLGGGALDLPGFNDGENEFFEESIAEKSAAPWWRRRRTIVLISVVLLVVVVSGVLAAVLTNQPPSITYLTAQVAQGNLAITVSATGPVQSATYPVNFASSGKIAEIDVSVGQHVNAGQVLAKLDPTALQDALNQAQIQAYLAYDTEQQALAKCSSEGSNAPVDCVQQAENQYALALNQLTTAQHNLANATLTAPHAGTVVAVNGVVGGTPGTGSSSSGSSSSGFIELVDLSSFQIVANVNEADVGKVATGQSVTFTVSAFIGHRFRGTITSVSPLGQSNSNVVTYPVTIQVNMSALQGVNLLPGMTANVTITTAQRVGVLLLPASAVTFARSGVSSGLVTRSDTLAAVQQAAQMLTSAQQSDPTAQKDNLTASFVLERVKEKWVVKPVVLGLTNGTFYEVLAGLSAGESLVTGQQGGTTTAASTPGAGGGRFGGGGGFPGGGGGGFPGGGGGGGG